MRTTKTVRCANVLVKSARLDTAGCTLVMPVIVYKFLARDAVWRICVLEKASHELQDTS
jgi:hypothetical protein